MLHAGFLLLWGYVLVYLPLMWPPKGERPEEWIALGAPLPVIGATFLLALL